MSVSASFKEFLIEQMAGFGPVTIRPMCPDDWAAVHAIYAAGIATGEATFESEPPTWEAFEADVLAGVARLKETT